MPNILLLIVLSLISAYAKNGTKVTKISGIFLIASKE
jgi:hypothetical protein